MSTLSTLNAQLSAAFPARLVPLHDGRPGLRAGLHIDIGDPSSPRPSDGRGARGEGSPAAVPNSDFGLRTSDFPSLPILDFIASNETLDRYDEIICAEGWRLDNYRRNPVFQNAHQYGDIIFTLGKPLLTEVRLIGGRPALFQRIEFAVDANPMAKIAYGLYRAKFLNAVSVGFIPIRWHDGDAPAHGRSADLQSAVSQNCILQDRESSEPHALRSTLHAPTPSFHRKYLEQELLEVSAVGIPANPEALQLGLKSGAIERADLADLLDLLRSFTRSSRPVLRSSTAEGGREEALTNFGFPISDFGFPGTGPAAPNAPARASGVRSNEAHWLQLARDLGELLRRS